MSNSDRVLPAEGPTVATLPLPTAPAYAIALFAVAAVVTLPFAVVSSGESLAHAWANFDLHNLALAAVLGALILWKRPGHLIGWLLVGAGGLDALVVSAADYRYLSPDGLAGMPSGRGVWDALNFCWVLAALCLLIALPQLFPNGRLLSRRWRPLLWFSLAAPLPLATLFLLDPRQVELTSAFSVAFPLLGLAILASLTPLIVRFRRSRGVERQQFKWVFYGLALSLPLGALGFVLPGVSTGEASPAMTLVPLLIIPVAITVAVLRYRLYDIDIVINKTLVYGMLTFTLALVYLALVLLLQAVLRPVTDQSDLAVAVSTLAVAALFRPARARIQASVDRRFYRNRYDAARTLELFTSRLRDEVDLESVSGDLRGVVRTTMEPAHVSVWIRP
jgi:hypothetical protein